MPTDVLKTAKLDEPKSEIARGVAIQRSNIDVCILNSMHQDNHLSNDGPTKRLELKWDKPHSKTKNHANFRIPLALIRGISRCATGTRKKSIEKPLNRIMGEVANY